MSSRLKITASTTTTALPFSKNNQIIQLDGCLSISDSDTNETISQSDIESEFGDSSCDNLSLPSINKTNSGDIINTTSGDSISTTSGGIMNTNSDDRTNSALNMPVVATYNMRSLFPKIGNLKTDILERKNGSGCMA